MKKTVGTLCLVGGILGILVGFIVMVIGVYEYDMYGEGLYAVYGLFVTVTSSLAIVFGYLASKSPILFGLLLIAIAITGLVLNGLFYLPPFILILIAGCMTFGIEKPYKAEKEV